jgi:hypothetical protein
VAAFYRWLLWVFYSFAAPVRCNRVLNFRLLRIRSEIEEIIYGMTEILFAAKIAFRGLDRSVPQQKLNLLKLAASIVAQLRTGAPQVVRRNVL